MTIYGWCPRFADNFTDREAYHNQVCKVINCKMCGVGVEEKVSE